MTLPEALACCQLQSKAEIYFAMVCLWGLPHSSFIAKEKTVRKKKQWTRKHLARSFSDSSEDDCLHLLIKSIGWSSYFDSSKINGTIKQKVARCNGNRANVYRFNWVASTEFIYEFMTIKLISIKQRSCVVCVHYRFGFWLEIGLFFR